VWPKKNISNNLKGIMSEMVVAKTMHAAVFIEKNVLSNIFLRTLQFRVALILL